MSGEDQERFEDYLELEQYIEKLQAGQVAHPPETLTPGQASVYRMAALFRSSSPDANEPRPEFVANLQARLEQELQQPQQIQVHTPSSPNKLRPKRSGVSRRALLTGGAAIAASLIVGVGSGATIEHAVDLKSTAGTQGDTSNVAPGTDSWQPPLVPTTIATIWHPVTTLEALGTDAIRFTTDSIVGYVVRDTTNGDTENGQIIAMSAACTHMGCIVNWQSSDHKFHCRCHGGIFTASGGVDTDAAPIRYLSSLPQLQTKVENGQVYVQVPASKQ